MYRIQGITSHLVEWWAKIKDYPFRSLLDCRYNIPKLFKERKTTSTNRQIAIASGLPPLTQRPPVVRPWPPSYPWPRLSRPGYPVFAWGGDPSSSTFGVHIIQECRFAFGFDGFNEFFNLFWFGGFTSLHSFHSSNPLRSCRPSPLEQTAIPRPSGG